MRKGAKLGLVLLLVAAGGALAYAGAAPEGYASVGDVVADPLRFEGKEIELKASVMEGSLARDAEPVTFRVSDGAFEMPVRWDPAVPLPDHEAGGTIEGKNVVVHGVVVVGEAGPYLLAHEMQVGCASKYRPADDA